MTVLYSKPHSIKAYKFNGENLINAPEWLVREYKEGRTQLVHNPKAHHVAIYDKHGGVRYAYPGDYICQNSVGTVFPLAKEEAENDFSSEPI